MSKYTEEQIRQMMRACFEAKGERPEFMYIPEKGVMIRRDGVEVCSQCLKPECQCE